MGGSGVLEVGGAVSDVGLADDQGRTVRLRMRLLDRLGYRLPVVPVDFDGVPGLRLEPRGDVLGEGDVGGTVD